MSNKRVHEQLFKMKQTLLKQIITFDTLKQCLNCSKKS